MASSAGRYGLVEIQGGHCGGFIKAGVRSRVGEVGVRGGAEVNGSQVAKVLRSHVKGLKFILKALGSF